jgi:hypothetical protein
VLNPQRQGISSRDPETRKLLFWVSSLTSPIATFTFISAFRTFLASQTSNWRSVAQQMEWRRGDTLTGSYLGIYDARRNGTAANTFLRSGLAIAAWFSVTWETHESVGMQIHVLLEHERTDAA